MAWLERERDKCKAGTCGHVTWGWACLMSPVAGSSLRKALRSTSLPSLLMARGPASSSLRTSMVRVMLRSSLRLSCSDSVGDRASSPCCTWEEDEQQSPKASTVREREWMSLASVASPVERSSARGGSDCREPSWSGGGPRWSRDRTPARNRFSSQRKEEVCAAALRDTNKQASLRGPRKRPERSGHRRKTSVCFLRLLKKTGQAAR